MRSSSGVSGFVATLILVAITLSLSYMVYEAVSSMTPPRQEIFTNQVLDLGGNPEMVEVKVNASAPASPQAFEADDASSQAGLLYFNGTAYGTTTQLCLPGATTFFSVFASSAGLLQATSNGQVLIDGQYSSSLPVNQGWHEIVIIDATTCQVTAPDGEELTFPSAMVSGVPLVGPVPSGSFLAFVPTDDFSHSLVFVFDGGYDRIA
jgi:flagellin-like protein